MKYNPFTLDIIIFSRKLYSYIVLYVTRMYKQMSHFFLSDAYYTKNVCYLFDITYWYLLINQNYV